MKTILLVVILTVAGYAETLLTGDDLIAWKIARSGVRDCRFSNCWFLPEDAKPDQATMKKTAAGDYEFTFVMWGREYDGQRKIDWEHHRMQVVVRVSLVNGQPFFDGIASHKDLPDAPIKKKPATK